MHSAEDKAAAAEKARADAKAAQTEQLREWMRLVAEERCRASFGKLFDHFVPLLRAYSLSQQPGAGLVADELAQDVMIKVWDKAHSYKPELAAPSTWIFTLARNCRIDSIRKNARFIDTDDPSDFWLEIEDESADPFAAAQQKRERDIVHEGLAKLPTEQKQVLAKVYLEGKTHQEVSEELTLPLGTVKSRLRLAMQKLQVYIKPEPVSRASSASSMGSAV